MKDLILKENENIKEKIYLIRGKQVMLDSDLAKLYQCKNGTKTINLAVKRHIKRFPKRFMFQLTEEECKKISRFQFETLKERGKNIKYLPYVFTEQGVAMLASVLRTNVAEEISIKIMDAFVDMKNYLIENREKINTIQNINKNIIYLNSKIDEHDNKIEELFSKFKIEPINHIFFNGEYYDSYSFILDILNKAKKEIIIIDNYADKKILDVVCKLKIKIN